MLGPVDEYTRQYSLPGFPSGRDHHAGQDHDERLKSDPSSLISVPEGVFEPLLDPAGRVED